MTKLKYLIALEIILLVVMIIGRFGLSTLSLLNHQKFSFNYRYLKRLESANYQLKVKLDKQLALNQLADWAARAGFVKISSYRALTPLPDQVKLSLSNPASL